jgi:MFS family permease
VLTSSRLGRPFWTIWTASTISNLGSGLTYVAMPLLAASYTRDARLVAGVSVATYLPPLLVGLHSGALVDRSDRRRLMWTADALRAVLVAALAVLVATGHGGIWVLAAVALLLGTAGIVFENAASAIVPMLVDRPLLERANSWLLSGQTVTAQFLGLPLGGALFAVAAALPFGLDALTYVVAVLMVLSVSGSYAAHRDRAVSTTIWQDVREGAGWLWRHQLLRTLALLLAAVNCAFAAGEAILVLYALDVLHVGRLGYSLLLSLLAVGALLGGAVAARARQRLGAVRVIQLAVALMTVALVVPALTSSLWIVSAALFVAGIAGMLWNVITISLRQAAVPARLLGRVTSAYRVVGLGAMPLGAAAGGLIAHRYGLRAPWVAAGALLALAALAALPFVRPADIEAAGAAADPLPSS